MNTKRKNIYSSPFLIEGKLGSKLALNSKDLEIYNANTQYLKKTFLQLYFLKKTVKHIKI